MNIIKRDGSEVVFEEYKIHKAIKNANNAGTVQEMSYVDIMTATHEVVDKCKEMKHTPTVEEVQDIVQDVLMRSMFFETVQKYIAYRYERQLLRKQNTTDKRILSLIELNNEDIKQENSNKNPIVNSVQRDYMAGEVSKDIAKRYLLPEDIVKAHEEGIIHFHDADYFCQHMHNCFSGGTKFVTDTGIRQFNDFRDGDKVYVRCADGQMREATVRRYGMQAMQEVTFKNSKMEHTVVCTKNHRWILKDGSVTTNLSVGDKLCLLKKAEFKLPENVEEAKAFCTGFVVGDGCDVENAVRVRLCGSKTKYADIFRIAGYSVRPLKEGCCDLVAYKRCAFKQDFLNCKGWRFMNHNEKVMAFNGYYSADGATKANRVSTSDERVELMIEELSGISGYYISSKTNEIRFTNYKDSAKLTTYHFVRSQNPNWRWEVSEIKPNRHGEVYAWCVEEPVTHSFTLEKGIVTGNCCLVNLEDMLQNGTVISETMIEKPHSFSTACNIATQVIAQIASSQYGGQSITLSHLAPFVDISRQKLRRHVRFEFEESGIELDDNKINEIAEIRVREEIKRGVQIIQYQVITLMTTNGQAPFVTVFMYLNEVHDEQTKKDLALIIEETLNQRYKGVKNESGAWVTPAFPKLIYVAEEDNIVPDSEYYYLTRLAAKCTAKRMAPDYISEKKMKELKEGNCFPVMGCRSALTPWKDENGKYKFYGRFNQGVVTLNLVDVACSSGGDFSRFWAILDVRLQLCYKALMCRHNRLKGTPSDVAPILWQHGALARLKKGETIDKLLYNGYSTISLGYAGLCECVRYMTGKSHTEPEGEKLALEIMRVMNDHCEGWKKETTIGFGVYGTPLESTTYKFSKCLQNRFGFIEGVTDKNYITNSYHVHVTENINAFEKLAFESKFQELSTGGAVSYVEVPNMQHNIESVLSVIKYIYDTIMYAELNTKSDYCQVCGFNGEIEIASDENGKLIWKCPNCGNIEQSKMNVARRTCGYIGTQFWNQGRTQEIKDRVLHL